MDITLLIGNGFDIQSGAKTRFIDFINFLLADNLSVKEEYTNLNQEDVIDLKENVIYQDIKKIQEQKSESLFDTWADFENYLGNFIGESAEETEKIFYDKQKIDEFLKYYLSQINNEISLDDQKTKISNTAKESVNKILEDLPERDRNDIKRRLSKFLRSSSHNINVLDFNFTDLFKEFYLPLAKLDNPARLPIFQHNLAIRGNIKNYVKVHGHLGEYVITGVDNSTQIIGTYADDHLDSGFIDFFYKPSLMVDFARENTHQIAHNLIHKGNLIIIFGMSTGESDSQWWRSIIESLKNDKDKMLILHAYRTKFDKGFKPSQSIGVDAIEQRKIKNNFLRNYSSLSDEESEDIRNRIFVVFNTRNMFNTGNVSLLKTPESIKGINKF